MIRNIILSLVLSLSFVPVAGAVDTSILGSERLQQGLVNSLNDEGEWVVITFADGSTLTTQVSNAYLFDTDGNFVLDTAGNYILVAGVSAESLSPIGDLNVLALGETTTPTAIPSVGKIYTKADNLLYFQDGAGTEHAVTIVP